MTEQAVAWPGVIRAPKPDNRVPYGGWHPGYIASSLQAQVGAGPTRPLNAS